MKRITIEIKDDGDTTIDVTDAVTAYDMYAVCGVLNRYANMRLDMAELAAAQTEHDDVIKIARNLQEATSGRLS